MFSTNYPQTCHGTLYLFVTHYCFYIIHEHICTYAENRIYVHMIHLKVLNGVVALCNGHSVLICWPIESLLPSWLATFYEGYSRYAITQMRGLGWCGLGGWENFQFYDLYKVRLCLNGYLRIHIDIVILIIFQVSNVCYFAMDYVVHHKRYAHGLHILRILLWLNTGWFFPYHLALFHWHRGNYTMKRP